MHIVKPDTLLEELAGGVVIDIETWLNEGNAWMKLADACENSHGDPIFTSRDITNMQRSASPAGILLRKLLQMSISVEELQYLLIKSCLYHIHDKIVTNDPMEVYEPEEETRKVCKPGEPVTLEIAVVGSPLPKCQWYQNNQALPGQNSYTLTINNFGLQHEGGYYCLLQQTIKGQVSEMSTFKFCLSMVPTPPMILRDLLEEVAVYHRDDLELAFEVDTYGATAVYGWYKDDKKITSSTEPKLRISQVDSLVNGDYHCIVKTNRGECSTRKARVKVLGNAWLTPKPQIIRQPVANDSYKINDTVHLICRVRCCLPVTFTCFLNNTIITRHHCCCSTPSLQDGENEMITSCSSDKNEHECELRYEITEDNMERLDWKLKFHFEAASSVERILTQDVNIDVESMHGKKTYTARNKWALLVGNSTYQHIKVLKAPSKDMIVIAEELKKLEFRVVKLNDLKKDEFITAIINFSKLVQKGDYVVFYFAGHGFCVQKIDYMVPVDAQSHPVRTTTNTGEVHVMENIPPLQCIDINTVAEYLQRTTPALILYIFDMCRHILRNSSPSELLDTSQFVDAKANSYIIHATSVKYVAKETVDMSCLMMYLQSIIATKISVAELGQHFKELFRRDKRLHGVQIPRTEGDLAEPRSLTDLSCPTSEDKAVGGVLRQWQRLSSAGGTHEKKVMLNDDTLRISVRCRHLKQDDYEGPTWVIGNTVQVVVSFVQCGQLSNTNSDPILNIKLKRGNMKVKKHQERLIDVLKKRECIYPVDIRQDFPLVITIMCDEDQSLKETFNLEVPAVSDIFKKPVTIHKNKRNI